MEGSVDLGRLTTDLSVYREWLTRWYGIVAPAVVLDDFPFAGWLPQAQLRRARLLSDLRQLGADPNAMTICPYLPPVENPAVAVGCTYVLEGAALGGGIVAAAIGRGAVGRNWPVDFVTGDGDRRGARWRAFRIAAEQWACDTARRDRVVAAAMETFAACERWFTSYGSGQHPGVERLEALHDLAR